jgi:hypothetical protein
MNKNWIGVTTEMSGVVREIRSGAPDVMKGFSALAQAALRAGALNAKTKELIAPGGRSRRSVRRPEGAIHRLKHVPEQVTLADRGNQRRDPKQTTIIRGLGFIGLMASGGHHQMHHLMMAKGKM